MKCPKALNILVLVTFLLNSLGPLPAKAQNFAVPQTIASVGLTKPFTPPTLLGIKIHPENPLLLDFIVDQGSLQLPPEALKFETEKLVKYFLAALTIPDKEAWVNLSPYEKDRIIPDALGNTAMGRTMLEQDYLLKQLAAALTNPEEKLGQEFWSKVNSKSASQETKMETMNKVWIVPGQAEVFESKDIVLISEKSLKVMMADEYEALPNQKDSAESPSVGGTGRAPTRNEMNISSQVFKETILPSIQKEVNEGKNFASVRQVYNSVILAAWYKKALKDSLLGRIYTDKNKITGIEGEDKRIKEKIYDRYLLAFKQGAYNLIKEEPDPATGDLIPRKYFSGGFVMSASSALKIHTIFIQEIKTALGANNFKLSIAQFELEIEALDSRGGPITSSPPEFTESDTTGSGDLDEIKNPRDLNILRFLAQFRNLRTAQATEKIQRLNIYMSFFQFAAQMSGKERSERERFLLKQLREDALFGSAVRSIHRTMLSDMLADDTTSRYSDDELAERMDEKMYAMLDGAYDIIQSDLSGKYAGSMPKEDFSRPEAISPSQERIQNIIDGIVQRVFGGERSGPDISIPRNVREGLGEIVRSIIADITRESPQPWYTATTIVDTFSASFPEVQSQTLMDVSLTNKILMDYYPNNDMYYRSLGITPNAFEQRNGYTLVLSVSPELIRAINAELSAYYTIPRSRPAQTTTTADPSNEPQVQPANQEISRGDLNSLSIANLRGIFSGILEQEEHTFTITLPQWRIYSLDLSGPQTLYKANLIRMIEDFREFKEKGRPDFIPTIGLAQDVLATIEVTKKKRESEGPRSDLPADFDQRLAAELTFANGLLFPRNDSPTVNTEEETAVWLARVQNLIDIKTQADNAPQNPEQGPASASSAVGGIDFDQTNLDLQIKRDGSGVPLPLSEQNLEHIHIDGIVPVIINIMPVNARTLPLLLGKPETIPDPAQKTS